MFDSLLDQVKIVLIAEAFSREPIPQRNRFGEDQMEYEVNADESTPLFVTWCDVLY